MEIDLDRGQILGGLEEIWSTWSGWADGLSGDDWATPSRCPGWTVQDNLAHLIGTERMLQGYQAPDVEYPTEHLKNPVAEGNERWVESMRPLSGPEVLAKFQTVSAERLGQLHAMSDDEILKVGWSPVGEVPYLRFMHVRIYDSWLHLEDCRAPLGHPSCAGGRPAEMSVAEVTTAAGFVIGKKAGAPDGSRVEVTLTGPVAATIRVAVDGRARVVEELDGEPTATLALSSNDWLALTGGRVDPVPLIEDGRVALGGDLVLARQLAERLAFTI
ncbi:MAG: maleylpyruvate isomerase family mycothiol-dependent enzyme [Actinomycetota bacterium]|nr:maleylpyruvate isomerase family mycothiol-dependent enzyme [Acidimicrobiales bacterium]MEC8953772.1 maleylpyruvate isomerase family mycothiol-dependent enzyme [Actinomycetota bacterium]GIT76775.1 MAG: hypothetical protein Ct9H300mP31_13060 [Acidimicrobiaceae bacterium]MCS5665010.1 maleylpyruvate isomerase family mycothiol-dependent enzyme [Acidimicrobiales bacterium]MDG2904966.1 maleylpyruvate isomerase family mycothiol-dependent enzyme [Acidimicrobiales bacterium]